jgi:hypothetical protein
MMVCRRRWRFGAVLVVAGAFAGTLTSIAAAALPATAADMRAAAPADRPAIREKILRGAEKLGVVDRDKYGRDVADNFAPLLTDPDANLRLNGAMTIEQLLTLSLDRTLEEMLKNPSPDVRYWGAKGLGGIAQLVKSTGSTTLSTVIQSLTSATKVEKVGVVQAEIIRALTIYDDVNGLLDALEASAPELAGGLPDRGMIDAVTAGLEAVNRLSGTAPPATKQRAAAIAARVTSFAAQQLKRYQDAQKMIEADVPANYTNSTVRLVDAGVKVMGTAAGKTFNVDRNSPDGILLTVNGITGAKGRPGDLQKAMPGVPVPPDVGAPPTTAPRS